MPILLIDYARLVLQAYEEKRDASLLSQRLVHHTNTNLRTECLDLYKERSERGEPPEENTLKAFFGTPAPGKDISHAIGKHELDKFRPLQNLMKGEIKNPNLVNVELLAWLIDFKPRPFSNAQKIIKDITPPAAYESAGIPADESMPATAHKETDENKTSEGDMPSDGTSAQFRGEKKYEPGATNNESAGRGIEKNADKEKRNRKRKLILGVGIFALLLSGGIYLVKQKSTDGEVYGNGMCMYWAEDHYEPVACNDQTKDRLVLPLREDRRQQFRKITQEDTISNKSIGSIYYISIGGKLEYYTAGGNHPIEVNRRLKKLSPYIFEKHLWKAEGVGDSAVR